MCEVNLEVAETDEEFEDKSLEWIEKLSRLEGWEKLSEEAFCKSGKFGVG